MAIDTNALTLGSSAPAKSAFQTRASGAGNNQVANDQGADADPSSQSGASPPASQATGSDTSPQGGSTAQKSAGPSAQTRTNSRATRASKASASTATAPAAPATDVTDTSANFGSVMASALERSAATAAAPAAPTAAAAAATPATDSGTTATQPDAKTPGDAVAWIVQVLTPPMTGVQAGTAPAAAQATPGAALVGSVAAASSATVAAITTATAAQAAALPAGAAAAALRTHGDGPALPHAPNPQTTAVAAPAAEAAQATPATALDGLNAMADVQKLISGMTAANSANADSDGDDNAADAPPAHATPTASADGTQAAAALQASALTRSDSQGSATLSIQAPVGSAAFADEVSARVSGLAQSGITQAQLQLNPADLGPVQVHITMQAGQASVWFGANHADTRAALEQSLPRLRELFAGAGMPLTDSGVFREPPPQQQAQSVPSAGTARSSGSDTASAPAVTQVSNIRLSLLDTYA